jgi:FkbM family methyltransferase
MEAEADPDGVRGVRSYVWGAGDGEDVHYRCGTSDVGLVYDVLLKPRAKAEYWLPTGLEAGVVLDIGANVGVTSRYLAHRFPRARVHAFEPVADNVELLRRNAACCERIVCHPYGLGPKDGEFELRAPDARGYNRGGYSLVAEGTIGAVVRAPIRNVRAVLKELEMREVDVIKIDTEGAEYQILSAFPEEVLSKVSWIYGELHCAHIAAPTGFKVLDHLSPWFDVEVHKSMFKRTYFFDACRKDLGSRFGGFRRRR